MKTKLLHEADGKRTFAVILQTDDEAMRCLAEFAENERIGGAQVTAIGALRRAKLAYFDWETKAYQPIEVGDQVEVASLVGDIAIGPDGKPSVHVHAVLGRRDGSAMAGHLEEAHVRPTLEIIVTESLSLSERTGCAGFSPSTAGHHAKAIPSALEHQSGSSNGASVRIASMG